MMMDYAQALRCTDGPTWRPLAIQEKMEALQAIENHIATLEGRTERMISLENMPEGYFGYYDHSNSSYIHLSPYALETPEDAISTVLHEGRHAYQHDCLDCNEGFPQPILDQFRNGFDNYISPEEDFKAYANNFTELDAESFAEQQCRLLNIDRDALLRQNASIETSHLENDAESPSPHSEARFFEDSSQPAQGSLATHGNKAVQRYDWPNQTTYPILGREVEKVKDRSESETLVTNLRDLPMSSQDLMAYRDYFSSDEVTGRSNEHKLGMAKCLQGMAKSINYGDEVGYFDSRDQFLDDDAFYRAIERNQSIYSREKSSLDELGARDFNGGHDVSDAVGSVKENEVSYAVNARKGHEQTSLTVAQPGESNSKSARNKAVNGAWAKEVDRIRNGRGTWDWTVEQQAQLFREESVSGFEGSHMLSVKDFPEHADNPDNIQLIPTIAHFDGVHDRNTRGKTPNGIYNPTTGEVTPIEDGRIPSLPELELTDRYDPGQQEFHDTHPDFEQSGDRRHQGFIETKERHPEKSINKRPIPEDREVDYERPSVSEELGGVERTEPAEGMFSRASEEPSKAEHTEPEMNMAPRASEEPSKAERTEPKMYMAPRTSEEPSKAKRTEPEMNMAPRASEEPSKDERKEPEINMAPSASEEPSTAERTEPEMNMAPSGSDERNTVENNEPEMKSIRGAENNVESNLIPEKAVNREQRMSF